MVVEHRGRGGLCVVGSLALLLACGSGDTTNATGGGETGESVPTGETDDETGEETDTGDTTPADSCWTSIPTRHGQIEAAVGGPEGVVALARDGLLAEASDFVLDPAITSEGDGVYNGADYIVGSTDDLWLLGPQLTHWDGQSYTIVSDEPMNVWGFARGLDDSLWFLDTPCDADFCGTRVWQHDPDDDSWSQQPAGPFEFHDAFAAGDDEQWLFVEDLDEVDNLYHRVGAGDWELVDFPFDVSHYVQLEARADGGLWMVSGPVEEEAPTRLFHRTPLGEWVEGLHFDESASWTVMTAASEDALYFAYRGSNEVFAWDGVSGTPDLVVELDRVGFSELFGYGDEIFVVDNWAGPTIYQIGAAPSESADLIYDRLSVGVTHASGQALNSVYGIKDATAVHWDGAAWERVDDQGGAKDVFVDIWADGMASAWALQRGPSDDEGAASSRFWRIEGTSSIAHGPLLEGVELRELWGRASDDIWALNSTGAPWHYDGSTWSEWDLPAGTSISRAKSIAGDAENVYILDENTTLHQFDGTSWETTNLPGDGSDTGTLAVAGELLFASYGFIIEGGWADEYVGYFNVWDGESWSAVEELWGNAPGHGGGLREDGAQGLWVYDLDWNEGHRLLHFRDGTWTEMAEPDSETIQSSTLVATPEGLFAHRRDNYSEQWETHTFWWACP